MMASQRTTNAKSSNAKASVPSEGGEGVCELCYHDTRNWAVGECDHPTCLRCSTKLRLLCGQKECPVCRLTLKKVCAINIVFIVCPLSKLWRLWILVNYAGSVCNSILMLLESTSSLVSFPDPALKGQVPGLASLVLIRHVITM